MKRKSYLIVLIFVLSGLSYSFNSDRIIDITYHWTSKTCPVHQEKLRKGKVDCVVGGYGGRQPANSNSYENPPYSEGEFPNAKFKYYSSSGCIKTYDKAVILYCNACESKRIKIAR